MRYIRLTSSDSALFECAMELYRISFPEHEQREPVSQVRIMSHPEYHFTVVQDRDEFVGAVLYWETDPFLYVEHFCVAPARRGCGCGREVLERLRAEGKMVILEIDLPEDEIAVRRKGFYERSGFLANPYHHVHPPYHENMPGHRLVVLSSPATLSKDDYQTFDTYLKETVMAR